MTLNCVHLLLPRLIVQLIEATISLLKMCGFDFKQTGKVFILQVQTMETDHV